MTTSIFNSAVLSAVDVDQGYLRAVVVALDLYFVGIAGSPVELVICGRNSTKRCKSLRSINVAGEVVGDETSAIALSSCVDSAFVNGICLLKIIQQFQGEANVVGFGVGVALPHVFACWIRGAFGVDDHHVRIILWV